MKRQLYALLLLASLVISSSAQKAQRATDVEANLRKHIEYLASDKLEGRRTGEPGANAAAAYVSNQFAKLRLRPGATDKRGKPTFMQSYPYITGVEMTKENNTLRIDAVDKDGKPTVLGAQGWAVGFSPNAKITNAPISFAGYGIVSKEANFDDYAWQGRQMDYKGDVVLVFDGNPENDNPHSPYGRFDVRTKALIAKDHGAVGMLLISREEVLEHDRLTKMEFDQSLGEAAIPTMVISRATARNILGLPNEESLKNIEQLAGMKKDGQNVNIGFRDVSPRATFSISLVKESVAAYDVIGILDGTDPQLKKEAIVIGAHYDHLGHGGAGSLAANSTEIHHGADDNASGTAAIIELARQFAAEKKNKRTIIFIAFSGEEEGLFGSNYYVNNPVFPLDKTVAMINLDMVGRLKDNKLTIGGIGTASEFKDLVTYQSIVPTFYSSWGGHPPATPFALQLNEEGFGPSDHSSFYSKKVPVLFFFTGTHNDYHKPSDTADKINYAGEHQVLDLITGIFWAIDRSDKRPTYTVAKTTMQGGRSGFNISLGTIPNYADSDNGLLLDGVRDGSPAAKAGLQAGDRVIKLAGHDIRNVMDYTYMLGEMKADVEYEIVVIRGGETLTKKITPVRRQ